jgi:hypothetical protein
MAGKQPQACGGSPADGWRYDAAQAVYLAVVGVGNGPNGLALAVLEDGGAYHFDLGQPMHAPMMNASRATRLPG